MPGPRAVAGLTAVNLLSFAAVLAMPVLAVPAILRGGVNRDLLEAAAIGAAVFVALFAIGAVLIAYDGALAWVGRVIQRVRNRLRRRSEPLQHLPDRLLRERDRIVGTLGPRWKRALAATSGRWAFDYATLLAALAAVGSQPRPSLVLLAFCAAQILTQIPITPGGLGFVEAGLTAMLTLAGVSAGAAVLATFVYRLFSYWLPLPFGLGAFGWHARRYRDGRPRSRPDRGGFSTRAPGRLPRVWPGPPHSSSSRPATAAGCRSAAGRTARARRSSRPPTSCWSACSTSRSASAGPASASRARSGARTWTS